MRAKMSTEEEQLNVGRMTSPMKVDTRCIPDDDSDAAWQTPACFSLNGPMKDFLPPRKNLSIAIFRDDVENERRVPHFFPRITNHECQFVAEIGGAANGESFATTSSFE